MEKGALDFGKGELRYDLRKSDENCIRRRGISGRRKSRPGPRLSLHKS